MLSYITYFKNMHPIHLLNPIMQHLNAGAPIYLPGMLAMTGLWLASYRKQQKKLQKAYDENLRDPLTGVANRRKLDKRINRIITRAKAGELKDEIAVITIDLDKFKHINDTYGHDAGDAVLIHFAETLKSASKIRKDLIVRTGGDEFVIIISAPNAAEIAETIIQRVNEKLNEDKLRIEFNGDFKKIHIGFSYGMHVIASKDICIGKINAQNFLSASDAEMYALKRRQQLHLAQSARL